MTTPTPNPEPELRPSGWWSRVGREARAWLYTLLALMIVLANPLAVAAVLIMVGNPYAAYLPPVASCLVAIWICREAVWVTNRNLTQLAAEGVSALAGLEILGTLIAGAMHLAKG